jgi:hypothetical protein
MLPVSDRFLAALRETHSISVAASVYRPSAPTLPIAVQPLGGSLTIDRDARVRRQASLDVAFTLTDQVTRDTVRELPFGGQAVIERGIRYADGTVERVQLGRFRVESIVWQELQGQATLTLADRMAQIQDEPFVTPFAPAGLHPSDAVVHAVFQVFGDSILYRVETDPASEPVLQDVVYDEDRSAALSDLASSVNAETMFDQNGDFLIRPRDRSAEVAWTVDAGDRGVMVAAAETLDRSSVRNGVLVRGQESADLPPFEALATYDDPSAPTRWGGPFGKVALISSSTAITSQEQAEATARSLLNLRLGLARTLTLQSVPNPALEPDDLIELVFADGRTEIQTINSVQLGLDSGGELALTTSSQLLAATELAPQRARVFAGAAAWRELADARLTAA